MKLFGNFEAVKFHEENMIFVTNRGYLYYIYSHTKKRWHKHRNAGNDHITVSNYSDVRKYELMDAMGGIFPKKETDFIRLCNPAQLWVRDMLALLTEDYSRYMSDCSIYNAVHSFLLESDVTKKSFLMLKDLLDSAVLRYCDTKQVLAEIKERDERDSTRKIAPLKPADDSVIVDTTGFSIDEVVEKLAALCIAAR